MKTTRPSLGLVGQCLAAGVLFALAAVWVLPQPARAQVSGDLRLQEGTENADDGAAIYRLEVYRNDKWHTLCDDGFNAAAAVVACKQLGHAHGILRTNLPYALTNSPIWRVDFNCAGSEARLFDCPRSALSRNCDHLEDVGVSCYAAVPEPVDTVVNRAPTGVPTISGTPALGRVLSAVTTAIADPDGPSDLTFTYQWELAASGAWIRGETGATYTVTEFAAGQAIRVRVMFTDAKGYAEVLWSAPTAEVPEAAETDGNLRLGFGNKVADDGRAIYILEIYRENEWHTLCDDGFDQTDAEVACGQLGFEQGIPRTDLPYPHAGGPVWSIKLNCAGSEARLVDCPQSALSRACGHGDDVGVSCYDGDAAPGGRPAITGTPRVGQDLAAVTSGISDRDGPATLTFTYQWLADDVDIASATASTYTLTASEKGKRLAVEVSFTDSDSNDYTLTSDATGLIRSQAPTGTPTITGTATVGQELTAVTTGISDPDGPMTLTFTYQWLADDDAIAGATASMYTITVPDRDKSLKVRVSFVDGSGDRETLTSGATALVVPATADARGSLRLQGGEENAPDGQPIYVLEVLVERWSSPCASGFNQRAAEVACGQLGYGEGLFRRSISESVKQGSGVEHTWLVNLSCAGTETSLIDCPTTEMTAAEQLRCGGFTGISCFSSTADLLPIGKPAITGTVRAGDTLTADTSKISDGNGPSVLAFTYQWLADGAEIASATSSTYELTASEATKTITVQVSYTDDDSHSHTLTSPGRGPVAAAGTPDGRPTITGLPRVGLELSADTSEISDPDGPADLTFSYQWLANSVSIAGATASSYRLTSSEAGKAVSVEVTFTDDASNVHTLLSASTPPVSEAEKLGDIRLRGASLGSEGRVEIYYYDGHPDDGEWVTVCDDGFTDLEASVACRQLGYGDGTALTNLNYAASGLEVVLTDVQCRGTESTLFVCDLVEGNTGCTAREEVGVRCRSAAVNAAPTGAPVIVGSPVAGQALLVLTSSLVVGGFQYVIEPIVDPDGPTTLSFTYQWLVDGEEVEGAGGRAYEVTAEDVDKDITVRVSFTDAEGNRESLTSAPAATNSLPAGTPQITGTAAVGQTLTADTSGISDSDGPTTLTFSYQWLADGEEISGASASTFQPTSRQAGALITVRVSYVDDLDTTHTLLSGATAAVTHAGSQGDLRLRGGTVEQKGRLEIYFSGEWGVICDNGFEDVDATVACKQLGYDEGTAWHNRPFDLQFSLDTVITEMACDGTETTLLGCGYSEHGAAGTSRCDHREDAGVACNTMPTGQPGIRGEAAVDKQLRTDTSTIMDKDGLNDPGFQYQWLREDPPSQTPSPGARGFGVGQLGRRASVVVLTDGEATFSEISGATGDTYTVTEADRGRRLKVRVTFTDDGETEETLESDPTAPVGVDTPALSIADARGTEGSGELSFEVELSEGSSAVVTVDYATADGTAESGADYTEATGTLTFAADTTGPLTIRVAITDDGADEAEEETFQVELSAAVNATLEDASATGTIEDNDDPAVTVRFGAASYEAEEDGSSAVVTVELSVDPEREVEIAVTAAGENGADSGDYTVTGATVTFGSGETSKEVTVAAVDDLVDDDGERVTLGLGTPLPDGVTAGSPATAVVTLKDNDDRGVKVSAEELTVTEGSTGSYTVVLESEPTDAVTVAVEVPAGTDVSVSPESLTFTSGNWSVPQTVTVTAAEDEDALADGVVRLTHAVSGGDYGSETAAGVSVTIREKDEPELAIVDARGSEGSGGLLFEVSLNTASSEDVTVDYATADGTAESGTDYTEATGTLTFGAGATGPLTIRVAITDDGADEAEEETFRVELSGAVNATLEDASATGTIEDDDDPAVTVKFGAASYEAEEGGSAVVTVELSVDPEREVEIAVTAAGENGADSGDYMVTGATVTFGSGETSKEVTVAAVDDRVDDDGERVTLGLGTPLPDGVTAGSPATAVVTLKDNDDAGGEGIGGGVDGDGGVDGELHGGAGIGADGCGDGGGGGACGDGRECEPGESDVHERELVGAADGDGDGGGGRGRAGGRSGEADARGERRRLRE